MKKKIAVVVRDRQGEALRVGVGLTLANDLVNVFIMDRKVEETEDNLMNLDIMKDMNITVFTNAGENAGMTYLSPGELAQKLLEFDHILPY